MLSILENREEVYELLGTVTEGESAGKILGYFSLDPKGISVNSPTIAAIQTLLTERCKLQSSALEQIGDRPIRRRAPKFMNCSDFGGTCLDKKPLLLELDRYGFTLEKAYATR